jgi:hypothetical protein
MSRANLANFNHRVHRDWHRVAQRKNIKKSDGFSLRFFNSKGAVGFNPQLYKKLKALASDFSIANEQVLLTHALKPIFQHL